jgi:hypothetical protein
MVTPADGLNAPRARLERSLGADSELLPHDIVAVGLVPERDGWRAYCQKAEGDFIEGDCTHFIAGHRGMAHAVGELAEWMGREWGFGGTRAREAAWRLFENTR